MNDQPAFPCQYQGDTRSDAFGLTMRDYFAAKAMQGMLSDHECNLTTEKFASSAYEYADAMLKERAK